MSYIIFLLEGLSPYLTAIVTAVGAIAAYVIYEKQKKDDLKNAARAVLLEVRQSEKIVKALLTIKESSIDYPKQFTKILPQGNWYKYSHLFVNEMANEEYEQMNEYYGYCETIEKYLIKNHNFFWVTTEERARQKESLGAILAEKNTALSPSDFKELIESVSSLYISNTSAYAPQGIITEINKTLDSITLISTTPTWGTLKRIARYKDILG